MLLSSRRLDNAPPVPDSQTVLHSLGGLGWFCCIYQQLYKNPQKLDPFSGSCRVQLVTRDLALEEAPNSSHVALPVHCGFGDFIRVGQLLPLVRMHKDREGSGGRGPGEVDCKRWPS